jgi:flavin reductase (DIM6/NTAB) family NADH-FMN oxidoreductase RutF
MNGVTYLVNQNEIENGSCLNTFEMIIDKETLNQYESRYRAQLMNSLAGVKQAVLIGTRSADGYSNLAVFNSLIHIGATPPLWGFICRPDAVKRDTLNNIIETGEYTLNFPGTGDFEKVHQTSAKYAKEVSEFEACGFTEHFHAGFHAPFVAEAAVKAAMKFEQKVDLTINNTILIIGSIVHIEIDEQQIGADGFVSPEDLNTLACVGLDAYYETRLISRLSYAKTDQWPEKIK